MKTVEPAFHRLYQFTLLKCTLLLLSAQVSHAQAPFFSQFESAPMLLNPAIIGDYPNITLQSIYRIQRLGQINYQTGYFSGILPLYQQGQEDTQIGSIGISFVNDMAGEIGEIQMREIHLAAAYNLLLSRFGTHVVSFGIQGGYSKTYTDYGKLLWPSQITYSGLDPSKPSPDGYNWRYGYVRISAGAYWVYDPQKNPYKKSGDFKLHVGFSADNLNQASTTPMAIDDSPAPVLLRVHGGSEHHINYQFSVAPSFFIQRKRSLTQYTAGGTFNIFQEVSTAANPQGTQLVLQAGIWYRLSDATVFMLGVRSRNFQAGLSYDVSVSSERAAINNQQAIELSLSYRFLRVNKPTKISTPLF